MGKLNYVENKCPVCGRTVISYIRMMYNSLDPETLDEETMLSIALNFMSRNIPCPHCYGIFMTMSSLHLPEMIDLITEIITEEQRTDKKKSNL